MTEGLPECVLHESKHRCFIHHVSRFLSHSVCNSIMINTTVEHFCGEDNKSCCGNNVHGQHRHWITPATSRCQLAWCLIWPPIRVKADWVRVRICAFLQHSILTGNVYTYTLKNCLCLWIPTKETSIYLLAYPYVFWHLKNIWRKFVEKISWCLVPFLINIWCPRMNGQYPAILWMVYQYHLTYIVIYFLYSSVHCQVYTYTQVQH